MQFRLREEAILKLTQQLSDGPPNSLASKWQCPPLLLFLNKQDKLPENIRAIAVQQVRQQLCKLADFQHVFEGAAMLGVGVQDLKQYLLSKVSNCFPGASNLGITLPITSDRADAAVYVLLAL